MAKHLQAIKMEHNKFNARAHAQYLVYFIYATNHQSLFSTFMKCLAVAHILHVFFLFLLHHHSPWFPSTERK